VRWLICFTVLAGAQDVALDTRALVSALQTQRQYPALKAQPYDSLSKKFRDWVEERLRGAQTVTAMNEELRSAGALDGRAEKDIPEHTFRNFTGYVDQVHEESVGPGLAVVRLGLGNTCSYDETLMLYRREPLMRIGFLHHVETTGIESGVSWAFSALQVREQKGRTILASAEFTNWCTSTLINGYLRIDSIEGSTMTTLLGRELQVRRGMEGPESWEHPIRVSINGDTVTFRYVKTLPEAHFAPAFERYSVATGGAVRIGQ
jgi:hypothetical protein